MTSFRIFNPSRNVCWLGTGLLNKIAGVLKNSQVENRLLLDAVSGSCVKLTKADVDNKSSMANRNIGSFRENM